MQMTIAMVMLAAVTFLCATALPNRVTSLPGLSAPLPSAVYSGYVSVDDTAGRALFFVFLESQRAPAADPLVIWFTGGPGCSGLIALMSEHGLFTMNFTAKGAGIDLNPYSWNTVANVIYVESPAGVGFSYSNTSSDYLKPGDQRTASDMYAFLQGFYREFPQFAKNDFWITGESYGGHYVPEFAYLVLMKNKDPPSGARYVPLKGIMAGNPWTSPEHEAFGVTDNWWDRAMISRSVHEAIDTYCSVRNITFWIINNVTLGAPTHWRLMLDRLLATGRLSANATKCFNALYEGSITQFGGVNILGVYLDVCNPGTVGNIPDQPNYCSDAQLTTWLNRADVQRALGVRHPVAPWA
jgi:serine carboxypeptidase-like clade 2